MGSIHTMALVWLDKRAQLNVDQSTVSQSLDHLFHLSIAIALGKSGTTCNVLKSVCLGKLGEFLRGILWLIVTPQYPMSGKTAFNIADSGRNNPLLVDTALHSAQTNLWPQPAMGNQVMV